MPEAHQEAAMEPLNQGEVEGRLRLIEEMMAEGRRSTERWGWVFLLWGLGPLMAMLWAAKWPHGEWAWPAILGICVILNGIFVRLRKRRGEARTAAMRSIGAVWTCVGVTVLLLGFADAFARTIDFRFLYVTAFALAAVAHGASSIILRWKAQFLAALVWWFASALAFVAPGARLAEIAAWALVLGNVAFGAWLSYCEWRRADG
jgi:hypothetical protein